MTVTEASKRIHWSLGGQGMLGSVLIQVPEHWSPDSCGQQELHSSSFIGVSYSTLFYSSTQLFMILTFFYQTMETFCIFHINVNVTFHLYRVGM